MSSLPSNVSTRWGASSTLAGGDRLADALRDLRRRSLTIGAGAAGGWGLAALVLVLVLFAWLDLILDLPGGVRLALGLAALATAAVVATRLLRAAARAGSSAAMAAKLDDAVGAEGQIVSGVALAAADHGDAASITAGLAQLAVARAARLIVSIHPEAIVPGGRALYRPYILFALTLLGIGIAAVVSPRLVGTQFARFTDPFGDHPPYSPLTFAVEPGDARIIYGASMDVRATVAGGAPDRVDLVLSTNTAEPLPMFPEGDGHWRATLSNVTADATYQVRSGRARSDRYALGVITVPKLTDVRFRVQLPDYTHRPPYEGPLPQNGIAGLPGTWVEVHAKSNRPLSVGTIRFAVSHGPTTAPAMPADVALAPIGPNASEVVGEFKITASGTATIRVTDVAGQPSIETLTAPITLLRDERPIVRMIEPKAESFATPDAVVKVGALAEDDYGISAVQIFRGLNDSRPRPTSIAVPTDPPPTQFSADLMLRLGDYALNPGDVVQLFARAQDTDPAGAKGAESGMVTLRIVSQKEMDRMTVAREGMEALQSKYAAAQRRAEAADAELAKLERELAASDPDKPLTEAQQQRLAEQSAALAKAAAEVNKLASHELPFDLDHALSAQLREMAKALSDAAAGAKKAGQPGLSAAGALDKLKALRKQLGTERDQFNQEASQPLEHMAKIFPLIQDQARFLDVAAHQKDLAARMAALQTQNGNDDPQVKAHMRDLEDEQRQVREDLRQLLDDIDDHVAALPDDKRLDDLRKTSKDFSTAVRASPATGDMLAAEASLQSFVGTAAADGAKGAADTLDGFIARCQSMKSCAGTCLRFQPKLAAGMGNTVQQMLESMSLSTGMGAGGVGGYSAMRSSLANVGLYGTIPTYGQESGSAQGGAADHGVRSEANGLADDGAANDAAGNGKQQANGQGDAPVPAQYKQRVGDYFQRVSDELSN